LERENELSVVTDNSKRLRQRLADLGRQVAASRKASERPLRLPKEHSTGMKPFFVIVQYSRVYPCREADLSRNDTSISWKSHGDSETANPISGKGRDAGDLQALFRNLPKDLVYVVFCVFEDSFAEFNRAKEFAATTGLSYGWEPFRNKDGAVTFSSSGHTPKPQ